MNPRTQTGAVMRMLSSMYRGMLVSQAYVTTPKALDAVNGAPASGTTPPRPADPYRPATPLRNGIQIR